MTIDFIKTQPLDETNIHILFLHIHELPTTSTNGINLTKKLQPHNMQILNL